jgi:hypothetical protein
MNHSRKISVAEKTVKELHAEEVAFFGGDRGDVLMALSSGSNALGCFGIVSLKTHLFCPIS